MENKNAALYQKIKERNQRAKNMLATVVNGAHAGEKLFLSDGKALWQDEKSSLLHGIKPELFKGAHTGLLEYSGERVFYEWFGNVPKLVICGGGHVSIALVKMAKLAGFEITVLEDRAEFAGQAREAGADTIICDTFENALSQIPGLPDLYFVIVTRGHQYDTVCLKAALKKDHAYVGMMGSHRRTELVRQQLIEEGFDKADIAQVSAPIGLSIHAHTPEEIAVSILAEIIQKKNGLPAGEGYSEEMLMYLAGEKEPDTKKALVTIIDQKGSAPRKAGTKMLVLEHGATVGTVGGGYAEGMVIRQALSMMHDRVKNQIIKVDMTGNGVEDAGMVCGGMMEVYLEALGVTDLADIRP